MRIFISSSTFRFYDLGGLIYMDGRILISQRREKVYLHSNGTLVPTIFYIEEDLHEL